MGKRHPRVYPLQMANILITGGAGFVGTPLTRSLVQEGHRVVVIDDLRAGGAPPQDVERFVKGDVRDRDLVADAVRIAAPDVVLHLAAVHYIPYCDAHPYETIAINVTGTRNVLRACEAAGVGRVVLASTAAVYAPADVAHSEDDELGPVDIYGLTKTWNEVMLKRFAGDSGAVGIAARLFNVYGPGDTNRHLIPELVDQIKASDGRQPTVELGNLDTVRDYVHVSDAAAAFRRLMDVEVEGFEVVNVGSARGWKVSDVVAAASDSIGRPVEVIQSEARIRAVDRPVLIARTARIEELGWTAQVDLTAGMQDLLAGS